MSAASGPSWEVNGGFTNTGLSTYGELLAVGDFTNGAIKMHDRYGRYVSAITLSGASNVQGVAWDASRDAFWVCNYAAGPAGSIKRYALDGSLEATIDVSGVAAAGPNGLAYDPVADTLLAAFSDNVIREYGPTGTLIGTRTVGSSLTSGGGVVDGVAIDPEDDAYLWVSMDTVNKIGKIARADGAVSSSFTCVSSPESIAFLDGNLYICADREYHESIADGNRVWRYDYSAGLPKAIWIPWGDR